MKIAVFIEQEVSSGGGFHQILNILEDLGNIREHDFVYVANSRAIQAELTRLGVRCEYIKTSSMLSAIVNNIRRKPFVKSILKKLNCLPKNIIESKLRSLGIDFVFFTAASNTPFLLENYHYTTTVWDLCHRDNLEFPEVYNEFEFEFRERLYNNTLPKAFHIIVDSNTTKEDIVKNYLVNHDRITVIPYKPTQQCKEKSSDHIDIRYEYKINGDFIFYPAQFWPHKNHVYIIEAISILKYKFNKTILAVFSGGNKNNKDFLTLLAERFNVGEQIIFTGYVPFEHISCFYKEALALVMPSYFGPTNLPPLEAFALKCPVLYGDIKGAFEQFGNSVLYLNLKDPNDLTNKLKVILEDSFLRESLIELGQKKLRDLEEIDNSQRLLEIFNSYTFYLRKHRDI